MLAGGRRSLDPGETIDPAATLGCMTQSRRLLRIASPTVALLALFAVAGCSTSAGSSPAPTDTGSPSWSAAQADPPAGRVITTGTVMDVAGAVELCLGPVAESYPPQCSGIPVDDWTWSGVDGAESSGDATWGSYAVYGTYDGERYTVTDAPIMLALYDPVRPEDPTGGVVGETSADRLAAVQDEVLAQLDARALSTRIESGYVWIDVAWDDGTLQDAVDSAFGDGVVIVTSAMREID